MDEINVKVHNKDTRVMLEVSFRCRDYDQLSLLSVFTAFLTLPWCFSV